MTEDGPIRKLQAFVDERWAVVQPNIYPKTAKRPQAHVELTPTEASYCLASVTDGSAPALFVIDDDGKKRSDRTPPKRDGSARGYLFFDEVGDHLRLETLVEMAAMARLELEFGWPRNHLINESPRATKDGIDVLHQDALDVLVLEDGCAQVEWKMSTEALRPRVAVEAKADAKLLTKLLDEMRACESADGQTAHQEHSKCRAIAELEPELFLGVAAGGTWRLFTVVEQEGRSALGEELVGLERLHFRHRQAG